MSAEIPTWDPQRDYWDRIGINRGPHADQGDDFTGLLPPAPDAADPTHLPAMSEHEFLTGEVPPEVVFTAGGAIAAPSQARRYASGGVIRASQMTGFKPLLDRIGPGAGAMVERGLDRARAFEVIARAAVVVADAAEADEVDMWAAIRTLQEAVDENRAAL